MKFPKFPIGHGWSRKFGIWKFQLPGVSIIGLRIIPIGGHPVRWWGPSIYLQKH